MPSPEPAPVPETVLSPSLPAEHATTPPASSQPSGGPIRKRDRVRWSTGAAFYATHLAILGAIWSGVSMRAAILALVLWATRMFAVTAGYHRYFSHRAFKTSRVFQFILAFWAQTSAQKGALWWAAHHRDHHKYSDQEGDAHSPVQEGILYAHMGWLFDPANLATDYSRVPDLAKYPELVWLNRFQLVPPTLLALATYFIAGWSGIFIGFFLSTVVLWHTTFFINSLTHVFGKKRFATTDESRNHLLLALVTLGEGWHNNHHHYQSAARCGFYWWEIDITYYGLVLLSWLGLVWDLRPVPERVLAEGRQLDLLPRAAE